MVQIDDDEEEDFNSYVNYQSRDYLNIKNSNNRSKSVILGGIEQKRVHHNRKEHA